MRSLSWIPLLCLLAGCPNPSGEFDEFAKRQNALDLAVQMPDMPGGGMFANIKGTFLLAVSTSLAPTKPLQLLMENRVMLNGDGSASLDFDVQPLSAMTRMPVGTK